MEYGHEEDPIESFCADQHQCIAEGGGMLLVTCSLKKGHPGSHQSVQGFWREYTMEKTNDTSEDGREGQG